MMYRELISNQTLNSKLKLSGRVPSPEYNAWIYASLPIFFFDIHLATIKKNKGANYKNKFCQFQNFTHGKPGKRKIKYLISDSDPDDNNS